MKWPFLLMMIFLLNPSSYSMEKVDFQTEVLKKFNDDHKEKEGTNSLAKIILSTANLILESKENPGFWVKMNVPLEVLLNTILPPHKHTGKKTLVPAQGESVKLVAQKFKSIKMKYKKSNKACFETISYLKKKTPIDTLFLATEPMAIFDDYRGISSDKQKWKGKLIHLDGLHRLIAIALMKNPPSRVQAYVAVFDPKTRIDGLASFEDEFNCL